MTPPGHDEFIEMPGLFVLGALAPDDRARFEAHLRECTICAEEVRSLVPVVEGLARAAPLRAPPASLRARVLEAVGASQRRAQAGVPASAAVVPFWSRLGWLAAAASLVAALALGYLAASRQQRIVELEARLRDVIERLTTAERQVADARRASDEQTSAAGVLAASDLARIDLAGQAPAPTARGRAFWSRSRGMVFNAVNLPPLPAGKSYQVWVLTSASPPISAGVFAPDETGSARLVIKTPEDIPPPTRVAVTLEPAGGVPAPTGDMYLAGAVGP